MNIYTQNLENLTHNNGDDMPVKFGLLIIDFLHSFHYLCLFSLVYFQMTNFQSPLYKILERMLKFINRKFLNVQVPR